MRKKNSFIDKIIKLLIMSGLLIVPFLNYGEVFAFVTGEIKSQTELYTPIYIKALKDLIMISLIFSMIYKHILKTTIFSVLSVLGFLLVLILNIFTSTLFGDYSYIIHGLRWSYPIFIFLFGLKIFKNEYLDKKFELVLILLFILHFSFQLYELINASYWFGSYYGFSLRNPGIFLLPNTGSFFSVVVMFWFLIKSDKKLLDKILIICCILSVLLTNSGTGIITALIILIIFIVNKRIVLVSPFLIAPLAIFLLSKVLGYFRGENYLEESGGARLEIFKNISYFANVFSTKFGYYTNVANIFGDGVIVDSLYGSLLGNLGFVPFLLIIFLLIYRLYKYFISFDKNKLAYMLIFLLFSATTIILEAYPMNLLLALLGCKLFGEVQKNEHRLHHI